MANHPARDLTEILTGTGFIAYLDRCRSANVEAYDGGHEAAVTVAQGIVRAGGGAAWAMGVDTRIVARRIRRALQHAADLQLESAKALAVAAAIYNATLGAPVTVRRDAGAFDPTK